MVDQLAEHDTAIDRLTEGSADAFLSIAEVIQRKESEIKALTERLAKTEGDFAELLAKLAEIEARLPDA